MINSKVKLFCHLQGRPPSPARCFKEHVKSELSCRPTDSFLSMCSMPIGSPHLITLWLHQPQRKSGKSWKKPSRFMLIVRKIQRKLRGNMRDAAKCCHCIVVSNIYNILNFSTLFSVWNRWEKSTGDFNLSYNLLTRPAFLFWFGSSLDNIKKFRNFENIFQMKNKNVFLDDVDIGVFHSLDLILRF